MPLDEPEQVLTKYFEHHANMVAIWTFMAEMIQETFAHEQNISTSASIAARHTGHTDNMSAAGVVCVSTDQPLQELDFVQSCLGIPRGRFNHLERDMAIVPIMSDASA